MGGPAQFWFNLIFLALTLACILGGLLMVRAIILRKRRVTRPSCAACRYEVAGLETMTCPECGADLRQVGILTPRMMRGVGVAAWIFGWTLVLPLPAVLLTLLIYTLIPKLADQTRTFDLTVEPQGDLRGFVLLIESSGSRKDPDHELASIEVTLAGGQSAPLLVSLPDDRYRLTVAVQGLPERGPFDRHILAEWIRLTAGLDAKPDELAVGLIGLVDTVVATDRAVITSPFVTGSVSQTLIPRSQNWYGITATLFWLAVWAAIVLVVVTRRRRVVVDNS